MYMKPLRVFITLTLLSTAFIAHAESVAPKQPPPKAPSMASITGSWDDMEDMGEGDSIQIFGDGQFLYYHHINCEKVDEAALENGVPILSAGKIEIKEGKAHFKFALEQTATASDCSFEEEINERAPTFFPGPLKTKSVSTSDIAEVDEPNEEGQDRFMYLGSGRFVFDGEHTLKTSADYFKANPESSLPDAFVIQLGCKINPAFKAGDDQTKKTRVLCQD